MSNSTAPSKVTPLDNRDLTSMVLKLQDRIAKLEADTGADIPNAGRFTRYKEEVREMLFKHNEQRSELESKFEVHFNALGGGLNMVHQGLNRLEGRTNMIWNTFNAFVRFVEKLILKPVVEQPRIDGHGNHVTETQYLHPAWPISREEFTKQFTEAGIEVFKESKIHDKAEFARMKEEKAKHGKVLSAAKSVDDPTDCVARNINSMVQDRLLSEGGEIKEMMQLDREARESLSDALSSKPPSVVKP